MRKSNSAYKDARLVCTDIQSDLSSRKCCNPRIMFRDNRLSPFPPAAINPYGPAPVQTSEKCVALSCSSAVNSGVSVGPQFNCAGSRTDMVSI